MAVVESGVCGVAGGEALADVLVENGRLRVELAELGTEHARLLARETAAAAELEALRAELATLRRMLFGRSSERASGGPPACAGAGDSGDGRDGAAGEGAGGSTGRPRGPGARSGRRSYDHLARDEVDGDFEGGGYTCPSCGASFTPWGEHVVEQLDWVVSVRLRVTRRRRYRRGCRCGGPVTVTAPGPSKAIGKGLFTHRFLALLVVERYVAGRSQNSLVTGLSRQGAEISPATLTGACAQVGDLLAPLAEKIAGRSRGAWHLHADETTWRVFTPTGGDGSARWWLWVFLGPDSVCFVMDPTRSAAVLADHVGIDAETGQLTGDDGAGGPRRLVISSDFYAVYASAGAKADGIVNLFCWVHVRRYFLRAGDANPAQLGIWARQWRERIAALYAAHAELAAAWQAAITAPSPPAERRLATAYTGWDRAIDAIDTARREHMASPGLPEPARRALATMDREWTGLVAHRNHPMIGLDNNPAERIIRKPVITRRNTGGSRTDDAARRAATIFTVTATADLHGLNPLTYLADYLDACGRAGARAPTGTDLDRFLPWAANPDDLARWRKPPG
ncbi:IS66 family transposase [Frankia casuarinae]|nr:IS66 family transposase [Frankia casuarinae]